MGELAANYMDNDYNVVSFLDYAKKKKDKTEKHTIGESTRMECLYNDEEILAVYNVFKQKADAANTFAKKRKAQRNLCMFVCAIQLGLRGGDFCSLKWNNIFDKDWCFLRTPDFVPKKTSHKKNPAHIRLIWNNDFIVAISNYLNWKRNNESAPKLDDYIFTSQKGGHISNKEWWQIMSDTAKEAGIKQKIGTHGLRKTMAHQYITKSNNPDKAIVEMCEQLGHSSLRMTTRYSCLADENAQTGKDKIAFIY